VEEIDNETTERHVLQKAASIFDIYSGLLLFPGRIGFIKPFPPWGETGKGGL